jgi:hypothetical protein
VHPIRVSDFECRAHRCSVFFRLYELVRRRCYRIVICDAEQDEEHMFGGIASAIRGNAASISGLRSRWIWRRFAPTR